VSSICVYIQVSKHQFTIQYIRSNFVINYVNEHQLPDTVKHIPYYAYCICQLGSCVIWNYWWRHWLCLGGSRIFPGLRPRLLALN